MRRIGWLALAVGVVAGFLLAGMAGEARAEDRRVLRCRVLARDFMTELTEKIQAAIHDGGPASAVGVCRQVVPELEARYSLPPGIEVKLTALECWNQRNLPDQWEKRGLEHFLARRREGAILAGLEFSEPAVREGKPAFRYLRALPTGSLCLQCHGERLAPKVKKALRRNYPGHNGAGCRLAELRGGISVTLYP